MLESFGERLSFPTRGEFQPGTCAKLVKMDFGTGQDEPNHFNTFLR